MALTKTIAAHRNQSGEWVEQQEIVVGPMEEEAILSEWAIGEHEKNMPAKLTTDDKVNILCDTSKGQAEVARKTQEYESAIAVWESEKIQLEEERLIKTKDFHEKMATLSLEEKTC